MKQAEDGGLVGVRLDFESGAALEEEGLEGNVGGAGGLDLSGEVAEVEFLGDRVLAVIFHHALDVQLLAVVFFTGFSKALSEGFAGEQGGAFDLGGILCFQILEADGVRVFGGGEEADVVETFGRERRENLGVDRGLRWKKVLQTRKSLVLGLQENQRVAQDCNRVLSAPYSRRNLRLSGDTLVADGIAGQWPVIRRTMRVASILRVSLLDAECWTSGGRLAVYGE